MYFIANGGGLGLAGRRVWGGGVVLSAQSKTNGITARGPLGLSPTTENKT